MSPAIPSLHQGRAPPAVPRTAFGAAKAAGREHFATPIGAKVIEMNAILAGRSRRALGEADAVAFLHACAAFYALRAAGQEYALAVLRAALAAPAAGSGADA